MQIKIYKANPSRMEKTGKKRDSFTLQFFSRAREMITRDMIELMSVYAYNGHEVTISSDRQKISLNFRKTTDSNSSAFFLREFPPTDVKFCMVCQHKDSVFNTDNLKKTHCRVCKMDYFVCDQCTKKIDIDLLSEDKRKELRWSKYKVTTDDFQYTDHETYISQNFCSTACLETYKIVPEEELE